MESLNKKCRSSIIIFDELPKLLANKAGKARGRGATSSYPSAERRRNTAVQANAAAAAKFDPK